MDESTESTTRTPLPVKWAVGMMGLSATFMLVHVVLNTLKSSTVRVPVLSVIITAVFLGIFLGLLQRKVWAWWGARVFGILSGIAMILGAVSALWMLREIRLQPLLPHEQPPSPLMYITILIMLLQPAPPFVAFFALGRKASRQHFGVHSGLKDN